jgi:mono/diheme cytochrome c family protein
MLRNMMIAGGLALAAMTAGCATTADKPAPAAPAAPAAAAAATSTLPAAVAAAQAPGESIFMARCNGCHGTGAGGAPAVNVLATKEPGFIVEALTTGKMARMGAALSAEDKNNVAMYLTKKPI